MTNRIAGFLITLDENIREDDAEATVAAIKQIKGVLDVTPLVANPALAIAHLRAKQTIRERLFKALEE